MRKGFTLIEVTIAAGLFALVSLVGVATITSVYRAEAQTGVERSRQQAARLSLDAISRELRLADDISGCPGGSILRIKSTTRSASGNISDDIRFIEVSDNVLKIYPQSRLNGAPDCTPLANSYLEEYRVNPNNTNVDDFLFNFGKDGQNQIVFFKLVVSSTEGNTEPLTVSTVVTPRLYKVGI